MVRGVSKRGERDKGFKTGTVEVSDFRGMRGLREVRGG
jgi:hypothetical protein